MTLRSDRVIQAAIDLLRMMRSVGFARGPLGDLFYQLRFDDRLAHIVVATDRQALIHIGLHGVGGQGDDGAV